MQSQFANVIAAVSEKLGELSDQITSEEPASLKRSAQQFSSKFLNQRKRDLLNLQETLDITYQRFQFLDSTVLSMI